MKLIPAIVLLLALTACDKSIDDIEEQRSIWRAAEPNAYSYTIQVSGWRSPTDLLHPKRVSVSEGGISASYAWQSREHDLGDTALRSTYWSVAETFDVLIEAKRRNAQVRARFNREFGFAERAFVEYGAPSSGWDVEIRDFEVAR